MSSGGVINENDNMDNSQYLFIDGHLNKETRLNTEFFGGNTFYFFELIKSISNDVDFKYTSTRQLNNSSFSLSFFLDNNEFISNLLPASVITSRIFDETKNIHIINKLSADLKFITSNLFTVTKCNASFYFRKNFSSIKNLTYYELDIRMFNSKKKSLDTLFLRYYFNKKDIPKEIDSDVLILNDDDSFRIYIFNELNKKMSLNLLYSEENYNDLMRLNSLLSY